MADLSAITAINTNYAQSLMEANRTKDTFSANKSAFDYALDQAKDMIKETNQLQTSAEIEEINFALGYSDSTHDLQIAQEKANIALQYTMAVRDRFLDAYNDIMNMQM